MFHGLLKAQVWGSLKCDALFFNLSDAFAEKNKENLKVLC